MATIWYGGTIYTMDNEQEQVEAVLTKDGKIAATGSYDELRAQADSEINLQSAVLYPGFIDSHMHMIGYGEMLLNEDVSACRSADEMLDQLQAAWQDTDSDDWLIGEGWDENNFADQRIPSLAELDAVTNSPMLLKRTCRHAILVNSKAMELAGINKDTPNPADGVIMKDEDGNPTGYLKEGAQEYIYNLISEPTAEHLTRALSASVDDMLASGLTGAVTDDLGYYGDYRKPLQAFNNVINEEKKFRAHLLRRSSIFEQVMEDKPVYNEPWIDLGEMKFFIDGALGAKTALLSQPYADTPATSGMTVWNQTELEKLMIVARSYEEAIAVHIIGDGAVEIVLDLIEKYPAPAGKRDRLIHVNVLRDDLVDRMAALPVILDIQPVFVPSDFPWVLDRLGPNRLEWAYAWKRLLDRGFICGGGSDAPVEPVDPLLGIYAAVTRRKPGETHEGYLPNEKLSRFEAIGLFTTGSAATIGKAEVRGKVKTGFDADFTVLDQDLFQCSDEEILKTKVVMTVIAEDVRYEQKTEELG